MLQRLSIRNIVLIDALDLDLTAGLTALTGETGAGKSILLDALGLALGERSDASLIRTDTETASVTAEFTDCQMSDLLDELGVEQSDTLILRRTLGRDGKSRAFLNDQPIGVTTLKTLASRLIEIEGQFGVHALLERDRHRALLDLFGNLSSQVATVKQAWSTWRNAKAELATLESAAAAGAREEQYLRASVEELHALDAQEGEEEELVSRRTRLQQQQKLLDELERAWDALSGETGAELKLSEGSRSLQRLAELLPDSAPAAVEAIDRAATELAEAVRLIEYEQARESAEGLSLEAVEDRLYKLRGAARKYQVTVTALATLTADLETQLAAIDGGEEALKQAHTAVNATANAYQQAAEKLSKARRTAATTFDKLTAAELTPLKLDRARFVTDIQPLTLDQAQENGRDQVTFTVSMNPGGALSPLHKTASGGELARLLLALKVVLAAANPVATLIFDEADTGLGGATAAAVGERFARLAQDVQVIVITHSPQVAAQADTQLRISKAEIKKLAATRVVTLSPEERREEIARMLSGNAVTDAARAAADALLLARETPKAKRKKSA